MKRSTTVFLACLFAAGFAFSSIAAIRADDRGDEGDSRVQQGFRIAEKNGIALNLSGRNRALVGLGSYIVNAQGVCADCHSCPTYQPGHNPYGPPFGPVGGGDGKLNANNYLAGGVLFAPPGVTSANLTPLVTGGHPEQGNTFAEFDHLMRTGHEPNGDILQVMPWPIFRNMTDRDLRAIYEFLSAIPPATPGVCVAPGQ
jgi:hypothetical protein